MEAGVTTHKKVVRIDELRNIISQIKKEQDEKWYEYFRNEDEIKEKYKSEIRNGVI